MGIGATDNEVLGGHHTNSSASSMGVLSVLSCQQGMPGTDMQVQQSSSNMQAAGSNTTNTSNSHLQLHRLLSVLGRQWARMGSSNMQAAADSSSNNTNSRLQLHRLLSVLGLQQARMRTDEETQRRRSNTQAASRSSHSSSRIHYAKHRENSRGVLSVLSLWQAKMDVDDKAQGRSSSSKNSNLYRSVLRIL